MTSLVTGGMGFLGSNLVRRLVERGEEVVAFDVFQNLRLLGDIADRVKLIQGDITNLNEVVEAIKVNRVNRIYHMAALLTGVDQEMPLRAIDVNAVGMGNVFEACRLMDVERVIFTSSIAIFDGIDGDITDDSPTCPVRPYGGLKLLGEIYGMRYYQAYGVDFRAVRLPVLYGAGDLYAYHYQSQLAARAALGLPTEIQQPANWSTTITYVKDAADAHIAVIDADKQRVKKRIYLVDGWHVTLEEYAKIVRGIVPGAEMKFLPKKDVMPPDKIFRGDYLRRELGWKPSYTMEQATREIVEQVRANPGWYSKGYFIRGKYV
jgi:nucleoside-diphosphate-sugar epimerase